MLTHGPPHGILDEIFPGENVGCENLRRAVERCKPRIHAFGHIHEGWGAERWNWKSGKRHTIYTKRKEVIEERCAKIDISKQGEEELRWGEETLFVNASIMDVDYNPVNAPWVVDLELPLLVPEETDTR